MIVIANRPDLQSASFSPPKATAAGTGTAGPIARLTRLRAGHRRRQVRPATSPAVSLAIQGIADGRAFVSTGGARTLGYRITKRAIDLAGAIALLALLAPVAVAVLLTLLITTKGKPLFFQTRLGYQGRPFRMAKFRTMVVDAEARQAAVRNEQAGPVFKNRRDPRVTRFGALLRKTSLDEIPQLLNVVLGQMSLVGPRPPIAGEVAKYDPWQRRRLAVKPGLTCLWQVSGRCEVGFLDWVRMDLWYIKNQSLRTDLWLLAKTPLAVLARRGAY